MADAGVIASLGLRAAGVVTAMTTQRPAAPVTVAPRPAAEIVQEIKTLVADLRPAAVKIGMVGCAANADAVADALAEMAWPVPVVIDPVLTAGAGGDLAGNASYDRLLAHGTWVTPNVPEAVKLTGLAVDDLTGMRRAAAMLRERGPRYVLIKGGHLTGDPVDLLVGPEGEETFSTPRIGSGRQVHGTGCALSSLIAGYLALGETPAIAARRAVATVRRGIEAAWAPSTDGWMYLGISG